MGSRYLADLADVCRRTGYPVIVVDGWQDRARGSGGYDSGRPNHVIIHHSASGPDADGWSDVNYCCYGDPDAPLCNLYLARDGTIYVCAAGATNTNGSGSDLCGIVPDDSMNSSAIGIEAGNDGVGEPWPEAQQQSYVALCGALCAAYGIGVEQIHSHAQWAPSRKIDPAGPSRWAEGAATWDMDRFRADVDDTTAEPQPPPTVEDDMLHIAAPDRAPALVSGNFCHWAVNEEEGQVMAMLYGPPVTYDTRQYDVTVAVHRGNT
jgi:N-acetylmuramoyl-L-alanine amidase